MQRIYIAWEMELKSVKSRRDGMCIELLQNDHQEPHRGGMFDLMSLLRSYRCGGKISFYKHSAPTVRNNSN